MKTFLNLSDKEDILRRVAALRADSPRQWGKMTCHQMVCHLNDSFLCGLGEKLASPGRLPMPAAVAKFGGLWVPLRWPKNVPTRPEMEQGVGGTEPVDFAEDRTRLIALVERFTVAKTAENHPIFGKMTTKDWMRWGYLHCDHHLRQFGE